MYELCLEFGVFPVQEKGGDNDPFLSGSKSIPTFLQDNPDMIARLEEVNALFHQLFCTIECTFYYIGVEHPDIVAKVRELYDSIARDMVAQYGTDLIDVQPIYV